MGRIAGTPEDRPKAHWWLHVSYLLAAVWSALGQLYVVSRIISSHSEAVDFIHMYVPFSLTIPKGTDTKIFAQGPWLFLQYDFLIISLSSLS